MKYINFPSQKEKLFLWLIRITSSVSLQKTSILLFLCILLLSVNNSNSQSNSLAGNKTAINRVKTQLVTDSSSIIEEKLVALALSGPLYKGTEHQNKINEYQLKSAKNAWLNLLTISTNYNDQTFANTNTQTSYVYPKYFFGLTLPLGTLFSRTGVKSAKEGVEISKINQESLARNIRADIISKYRQYKNYFLLIDLQTQAVDDEETAFLQAKEKFRNGTITIQVYNASQKIYNDEFVKKLGLQLQQDLLKIEIERIIGTSLESAIK
ncbi:MAG: TolC family protein [Chitinophagaceae bacterium]